MTFYTYNQNHCGEDYRYSADMGISRYVIVEADDGVEADERAESIGLDIVGASCDCCGVGWHRPTAFDTAEYPSVRGLSVAEYALDPDYYWGGGGHHVFVHYKDGTIEGAA